MLCDLSGLGRSAPAKRGVAHVRVASEQACLEAGARSLHRNLERNSTVSGVQGKIQTALATMGVTLANTENKDEFCIEASTGIVKVIAELAGVSTFGLSGRDQFSFEIIASTAFNVVDMLIESKFDKPKIYYEADFAVVLMSLFGAEDPKETGLFIGQIMDSYNELGRNGATQELGNGIMAWIKDPHPEKSKQLRGPISRRDSRLVSTIFKSPGTVRPRFDCPYNPLYRVSASARSLISPP